MMKSSKQFAVKVYALHGFLGMAEDWNIFDEISNPITLKKTELPFWSWAENFNKSLMNEEKRILIGYSLGGRLAMHLLIDNPSLWSGALIISAHPGLQSEGDKSDRLKSDTHWAHRFLHDDWDLLLNDWNQNGVFNNQLFPFVRKESEMYRKCLAKQLTNWSLGNQDDLLPKLQKLQMPILYLAGENDKKFVDLATSFSQFADVNVVPGASHRVPWEQKELFKSILNKFIQRCI